MDIVTPHASKHPEQARHSKWARLTALIGTDPVAGNRNDSSRFNALFRDEPPGDPLWMGLQGNLVVFRMSPGIRKETRRFRKAVERVGTRAQTFMASGNEPDWQHLSVWPQTVRFWLSAFAPGPRCWI